MRPADLPLCRASLRSSNGAPRRHQAHPNLRNFVAFKYSVARCSKTLARDQFSVSITQP